MRAMRRFSHWTQSKYGSRPINSEARAVCLPCAGHQRFLALSSERNQLAQPASQRSNKESRREYRQNNSLLIEPPQVDSTQAKLKRDCR
jgi:hypothetical protein